MNIIRFSYIVALVVTIVSCGSNDKIVTSKVISIPSLASDRASLPNLFSNSDKTILSWVNKVNDSTVQLSYSYLVNGVWDNPNEIINGSDWFVNWADYPLVVENNGNFLSHILKKSSGGTYSYDVKLNLLPNGEKEWIVNKALHTDSTKTEHGFVSAIPYKENSFFLAWLDGRNTTSGGHNHGGGNRGAMNIRAAEVLASGSIAREWLLDDKTCDCCQTAVAFPSEGPVVLYRDRSNDEIRDISITRLVGGIWTTPKPIHKDNWKIKGCPVNGPRADALKNNLVVAWYTAANDEPMVKVVFSSNGGQNFDSPILISKEGVIGRVDVFLVDDMQAIVSWMETTEHGAQIKAVKIHKSGKKYTPILISKIDGSRKSGFPQMTRVGDKVYFAWTNVNGENTSIKTAYVLLDSF